MRRHRSRGVGKVPSDVLCPSVGRVEIGKVLGGVNNDDGGVDPILPNWVSPEPFPVGSHRRVRVLVLVEVVDDGTSGLASPGC